jgi:hypothetical protein
MSNRRKLNPPDAISRFASAYRCFDCTGRAERMVLDNAGI